MVLVHAVITAVSSHVRLLYYIQRSLPRYVHLSHLALLVLLPPLLQLASQGKDFDDIVTFSPEHSAASHPSCLVVDLCADHHLLERGVSPRRVEQCLNLQVQK